MYVKYIFFLHSTLDIFSSSWVEADNAVQMVSALGPRSTMGVAKSCKATTDLANFRMKRNDQAFAKSMLTANVTMMEKYRWSGNIVDLYDQVFNEAITMYARIGEYDVFKVSECIFYVKAKKYKIIQVFHT